MHFNLHKTFSTPHGGGGPGSGPVGVRADLAQYLPGPRVRRVEEEDGPRFELFQPEESIGRVHAFHGNFGMFVRAYTYIRMHGAAGLRQVSEDAVLNANYLRESLREDYDLPLRRPHLHARTVFSATRQKAQGVRALDVAKRILDFGIHPPTVYFPLVVPEALMIEPTETESIESLDSLHRRHAADCPRSGRDAGGGATRAAHDGVQAAGRGGGQPQPQPALAPDGASRVGGEGGGGRRRGGLSGAWYASRGGRGRAGLTNNEAFASGGCAAGRSASPALRRGQQSWWRRAFTPCASSRSHPQRASGS